MRGSGSFMDKVLCKHPDSHFNLVATPNDPLNKATSGTEPVRTVRTRAHGYDSRNPHDPPCRASAATSAVQGMYELRSKGYTICFQGNPYHLSYN